MSDIMDGWNAGERAHLAKQEMERQKREDAWAAEERAQRRNQWQRDATAQTLLEGTVGRVSQNPTDQTGEFAAQYGLQPTERVVPSAAANYNKRQGFFGESEGPGLTLPAEEPKFGIHPKRQGLVEDYKISVAKGDLTGARGIKTQIDTLDMGSQAAALQQRVLNAPPDKVAAFAQKYTDSAHIPGSMVVDPKTMLTTLTLDGGKPIQMTRADMATYVTGLWKLNQGDPSGKEDIASIDKSLAAMADKRFGQMKDVAQTSNDAVAKASDMAYKRGSLGIHQQNANRQNAALDKYGAGVKAADEAAGLYEGYQTAKRAKSQGAMDIYGPMYESAAIKAKSHGLSLPGLREPAQQVDPDKYTQVLKNLMDTGLDQKSAMMQADQMFGVAPQTDGLAAQLQALDASKGGKRTAEKAAPVPETNLQPTSPAEFRVVNQALQRGLTPVGRGNSVSGAGELLFVDRQGNRVWASQIQASK